MYWIPLVFTFSATTAFSQLNGDSIRTEVINSMYSSVDISGIMVDSTLINNKSIVSSPGSFVCSSKGYSADHGDNFVWSNDDYYIQGFDDEQYIAIADLPETGYDCWDILTLSCFGLVQSAVEEGDSFVLEFTKGKVSGKAWIDKETHIVSQVLLNRGTTMKTYLIFKELTTDKGLSDDYFNDYKNALPERMIDFKVLDSSKNGYRKSN